MTPISTSIEGHVSRVTLARPGARNALDRASAAQLLRALDKSAASPHTRAILLTAAEPVFSTGLEVSEAWLHATIEDVGILHRLLTFGSRVRKPFVVAASGAALGAGAILCAAAHVALAAQGTSFGLTDIRVGQWPYTGWETLAGALGRRRALELSLTGRIFSAHDALAWGLIHEITQPSELEDRALATASLLAAAPPQTVSSVLAWLQHPAGPRAAGLANLQSPEAREGVAAFLEKRRPSWPAPDAPPAAG